MQLPINVLWSESATEKARIYFKVIAYIFESHSPHYPIGRDNKVFFVIFINNPCVTTNPCPVI